MRAFRPSCPQPRTLDLHWSQRRPHAHRFVLSALAVLSALVSVPAADARESERTVSCTEGAITRLSYGNHSQGCGLGPSATDQDNFKFGGAMGDVIRVMVIGKSDGLDPWVQVRHLATNQLVVDRRCDSHGGRCVASGDATLPKDGDYELVVFDWGLDETGLYDVQVERLVPADTGRVLNADKPSVDGLSPTTDHDQWRFCGREGRQIRLIASGQSDGLDPWIQMRAPDGRLVVDRRCDSHGGTCIASGDATLPASGVYSVSVFDWGLDETGDFEVNVQCLTSNCGCPIINDEDVFNIEYPGEDASGVSGVGGWLCGDHGELTAEFDNGETVELATHLNRADTGGACKNGGRNGFFGMMNYGRLGAGPHTVRFLRDGQEFGRREFFVGSLGRAYEPFARGLSGECTAFDFPKAGDVTSARWSQTYQGFVLE